MSVSYSMGKSASFFSDPSPLVLRAVPSGGSADEKPPQGGLCCVEIHTLPSLPSVGSQSRELGYLGTCLICCCHMCLLCYQEAENLVATVVPTHLAAAVPEVAVYLKESVGNSTRIDYGTGHEAAFAAFLCCLCKIGVLRVDDQIAIVFKVFNRYLEVMRKLQKTYRMEPAGSQGVWGLDDFQFLPFIWGSSQLIDHPYLEPRHFVDEKAVNENHKDYMFLECILFITEMKTGPFAEHSNQLWNISAVPSWSKVNQGLIRMYKAECLEKFPVIQHFKFGSLLPIHPVTSSC
uniref:Serine/threonine-protein phosphatase 2A activator n=1 Tax=Capra hircus TaxID=9925 RepID=A0A8C2SJ14_CAPHI